MREPEIDVAVIGGGVVGLSCAYDLAQRGRSVVLFERHARLGEETSTHNSGVIHAGIYYPNGSLKARLCVQGRRRLIARLREWEIPHRIGGKLIVAQDGTEIATLERLRENALQNGVTDRRLLDPAQVRALEPHVVARPALYSPGTGVFNVGAYLRALEARLLAAGGVVLANAEVTGVERDAAGIEIATATRGRVRARVVVNAAGLYADEVAAMCGEAGHRIHPCRGEYAVVIPKKAHVVSNLVYPVPGHLGLGVHLTRTVDGELWLGPDARFIEDKTDYEANRRSPDDFFAEAHRLCPAIERGDLRMGPSGIRPKRHGPGEPAPDFHIAAQSDDPRILHMIGIESPGLTASPAIGRMALDWASEVLD
ncbi:MAG: NAD(P)/FAD-dependent oxidoreductase [Deltaproteobacteria bacterium]|nr:NAD(P)/FAD-dependent oxidoreductase [Deltaproteobacteria bacterium]